MDVVLETIGVALLKKKLVARHIATLAHLVAAALCVSTVAAESGGRLVSGIALPRGVCKCST